MSTLDRMERLRKQAELDRARLEQEAQPQVEPQPEPEPEAKPASRKRGRPAKARK